MQTFLPYPNLMMSVGCLDYRRLGKQRSECKIILNALTGDGGWRHHPAVKMWRGYQIALSYYGFLCCMEWKSRGYEDSLIGEFWVPHYDVEMPPWFGGPIHRTHQSNLLRKDYGYYSQFNWDVGPDLDYYWPTHEQTV